MSCFLADALSRSRAKVISKGALYNVRPYEIERAGFKKGKKLNKLPANIKNTHIYHLDGEGRIVFVEIYGQAENIVSHEFYNYEADFIERLYFTSVGKLRNISVSLLDGEAVVRDLNWGVYGCSESDYVYDGPCLVKIHVRQKEHIEPEFIDYEVRLEYSAGEVVKIVNTFSNGYEDHRFP